MAQQQRRSSAVPPPPKRLRGGGTVAGSGVGSTDTVRSLLRSHSDATSALLSALSSATPDDDAASATMMDVLDRADASLLTLKRTQRSLCLQVESLRGRVDESRCEVDDDNLQYQNVNYEKRHWQSEIDAVRGYEATELERMAMDELGPKIPKGGGGDDDDDHEGAKERAVDAFLSSSGSADEKAPSHRHPARHQRNLTKLQTELDARRTLRIELDKLKKELSALQTKRDSTKKFLSDLPRRVNDVERSTKGIQSFFRARLDASNKAAAATAAKGEKEEGSSSGGDGAAATDDIAYVGTDRQRQIQLAVNALPKPLYVLYRSVRGYLDAFPGENDMAVKVHCTDDDDVTKRTGEVWLSVSAPDASSDLTSGTGRGSSGGTSNVAVVQIRFAYVPGLGAVTAGVVDKNGGGKSGAGPVDGGTNLLDQLFPGDDGVDFPNDVAVFAALGDEDGEDDDEQDKALDDEDQKNVEAASARTAKIRTLLDEAKGKPYAWCQSMAGLRFPPPSTVAEASTAAASAASRSKEADAGKDGTHHMEGMHAMDAMDIAEEGVDYTRSQKKRKQQSEEDAPSTWIEPCTRSVLRQIRRRVRASTALSSLLDVLERRKPNPIPIHPAMAAAASTATATAAPTARLIAWTEDRGRSSTSSSLGVGGGMVGEGHGSAAQRRYLALIKRRSTTLRAAVTIDPILYPAVPPRWSLQPCSADDDGDGAAWGERHGTASSLHRDGGGGEADGSATAAAAASSAPLFDAELRRIEDRVNAECVDLVSDADEDTYSWILVHQLAEVVARWDAARAAAESGGGSSIGGASGTERRGRDRRRVVPEGSGSAFGLYAKGL